MQLWIFRGRQRLRELAHEPDNAPQPSLSEADRLRLTAYVQRFNAREFDTLREMLAEDVRAELVNRSQLFGRSELYSRYFYHYGQSQDWHLAAGFIDDRPGVPVSHPDDPLDRVRYFILLDWVDGKVTRIRNFVHARYVVEGAQVSTLVDGPAREPKARYLGHRDGSQFLTHPARCAYASFLVFSARTRLIGKVSNGSF
jgi:RNA polymerase sigma-70 factor (ECF subfamily)